MFIPFDQINLEEIKKEIEEDRKKVKEILEGKIAEKVKDLVKTVLFIVESPNKARTIASFFGKPTHRKIGPLDVYEVTLGDKYLIIVATKGHVVDLTTDEIGYYGVLLENNRFIPYYTSIKRCKKCGYQWASDKPYDSCPRCGAPKEFIEDSKERLEVLKKLAQEADVILIGTDPDSITGDMKVKVLVNGKIEEKTVEELFNEWKENSDFEFFIRDEHEYLKPKKEIYVLGVDPEKLIVTWTKVNYLIRHKVKKPIYEIKTKTGKTIKVTGDHSLFTLRTKYEPIDLEGRTINIILFEEDFQKLTQKRPLFDKILFKQEISQEEIAEFLDKVGGVYTKVFIENLRIPAPVYFAGIDRSTRKRIFSLLLKEKRKLKEVKASELKIGDKIVVIENNRVILDEIVEIKTITDSEIYVYDFDTETDNFIANNVLCHNTEGEFIAWSVYNAIKPYSKEIYRAEFHEVTKTAILKAIQEVLNLNLNRVKAQIVRRVEDRWIGFALSKKVQNLFKRKTLSAGRVQTPVLGWIIKRFEEHRQSIQYFITLKAGPFTILIDELNIKTKKEADEILKKLQGKEIIIKEKTYYEEEVNPLPPYITNTMLNDAIRELRIGAFEVMQLAQDLFEWGLCLTPDSYILLPDGSFISIKDAYEKRIPIVVGVRNGKQTLSFVSKVWKIRYQGKIYRIKLSNGLEIKVTPDHKLLTVDGWKEAINIKKGDWIAIIKPKVKRIWNPNLIDLFILAKLDVMLKLNDIYIKANYDKIKEVVKTSTVYKYLRNNVLPLDIYLKVGRDDKYVEAFYARSGNAKPIRIFPTDLLFWYFVGYFIGDGSASNSKIQFSEGDKKHRDFIKRYFENIGLKTHEYKTNIYVYNSVLAKLFKWLKQNYNILFKLRDDLLQALIAGLIDADGFVSRIGDNLRIGITNKDKKLLEMIQITLLSWDIRSYIREDKRTGVYTLYISNKDLEKFVNTIGKYLIKKKGKLLELFKWYRSVHPKDIDSPEIPSELALKLIENVNRYDYYKEGIDLYNLKRTERTLVVTLEKIGIKYDKDILWEKVVEISVEDYDGYVYDLTTSTENFIANGIISHNCTYHRTDSTRVSPVGIALAKEYISQKWGEEYFKGRTWGTGGAHECIRPTKPYDPDTLYRMILEGEIKLPGQFTKRHLRLYSLIFWRFIASQMKPAKVKKVKYIIEIPEINLTKEIEGIVEIVEHGWDLALPKYFEERKIEDINVTEIPIEKIDIWKGAKVPLYTQADVISLMREKGIGRPSTYAQIMQKLLERRYVIETKRKKLVPTSLGVKVFYYLDYKYHKLVSEERTRELEKKMDMVEEGLVDYQKVLWETYEEMQEVERTKDDIQELKRILKDKFEAFKERAKLVAKTRKFRIRRIRKK